MWNYLVRRLLLGVLTLWLVTFLVYGLVRSMPGDPLLARMERMDPTKKFRPQDLEQMRKIYGLDKSWPVAYLGWLANVMQLRSGQQLFALRARHAGDRRAYRTDAAIVRHVAAVGLPVGRAVWIVRDRARRHARRTHAERDLVHALFAASLRGGAVFANDFRRQTAGHLAGASAGRHDRP